MSAKLKTKVVNEMDELINELNALSNKDLVIRRLIKEVNLITGMYGKTGALASTVDSATGEVMLGRFVQYRAPDSITEKELIQLRDHGPGGFDINWLNNWGRVESEKLTKKSLDEFIKWSPGRGDLKKHEVITQVIEHFTTSKELNLFSTKNAVMLARGYGNGDSGDIYGVMPKLGIIVDFQRRKILCFVRAKAVRDER